jgi:hypothetical protein
MAQFRTDSSKYLSDGKTIHEVVMLSDRFTPSGTATDAFGRLRVSPPYTLFDSFHRYEENAKWVTSTNGAGANTQYQVNESVIDMNVGTTSGEYVYRETKRVFAYQPGKSLLVMNTFAMNTQKTNLRQRVGYFSSQNGVFFENDGTGNYLVLRSYVTGSVVETRVAQANWNKDKFDGTGYSAQDGPEHRIPLDITKGNIFWADLEWLGVGDVRCGFVVDGRMVPAHIFHNDNINTTTYMTTAILPIRYEIENTGTTASVSKMKQICSSVQSEGGYELRGRSRTVGRALASPKDLPTTGTFTPVISIRISDSFPNGIAILKGASIFGVTNNMQYRYKIVTGGTLTDASWVSAGTGSIVEYDISATAITGGIDRAQGYLNVASGAGAQSEALRGDDLFEFQLERDPFAASNKGYIISLVATGASNGADALGHLTWEEVT